MIKNKKIKKNSGKLFQRGKKQRSFGTNCARSRKK